MGGRSEEKDREADDGARSTPCGMFMHIMHTTRNVFKEVNLGISWLYFVLVSHV